VERGFFFLQNLFQIPCGCVQKVTRDPHVIQVFVSHRRERCLVKAVAMMNCAS